MNTPYNIHDYDVPLTTVDVVVFTIKEKALHVLLHQRPHPPEQHKYALAGGFVNFTLDKDVHATAHRKLKEKTGVDTPYLEQVCSIGNAHRDPRGWAITLLYFALIPLHHIQHAQHPHTKLIALHELQHHTLAFDHHLLIQQAYNRLHNKAKYTALPLGMMHDLFTLTELQQVFELLLGYPLEAKSFRRRILESGLIEGTSHSKQSGKRQAQLFKTTRLAVDFEFNRALISTHGNTDT